MDAAPMDMPESMVRTTVYLTRGLRQRLKGYARERGMREAQVIRMGLELVVGRPSTLPQGGFLRESDGERNAP